MVWYTCIWRGVWRVFFLLALPVYFFFGVSISLTILSIEANNSFLGSKNKRSIGWLDCAALVGNVGCSWQPQAIKNRFQDSRKPHRRLRVEMRQKGWLSGNLVVAAVDGHSGKASRPLIQAITGTTRQRLDVLFPPT